MAGLPLLPLLDGTIKAIERVAPGQDAVYMCSSLERKLLSAQAAILVDSEAMSRETADRCVLVFGLWMPLLLSHTSDPRMPWCATCRLKAAARTGCLKWQLGDSSALVEVFLPRLLPHSWQGQAAVSWSAGVDGAPTAEWIAMLWQELQVNN